MTFTNDSTGDDALLDGVPSYISISDLFKAMPAVEAGQRIVYLEASNEKRDQQGEIILAKALESSAPYYLKFGNVDIDHITQIGAKAGIPDYTLYEIGRPSDVSVRDGVTYVTAQIYSGDGPAAARANMFWSSLTDIVPPARWYPSVGGEVREKAIEIDPETGAKRAVVKKVRWTNIGFSKTPVNQHLATVSTVPFEALAKSWMAGGFDLAKAMEAGYGTDSTQLSGGAALRKQSLSGRIASYWDFRDRLAEAIRKGEVDLTSLNALTKSCAKRFGLDETDAAEYVERFLRDLKRSLNHG